MNHLHIELAPSADYSSRASSTNNLFSVQVAIRGQYLEKERLKKKEKVLLVEMKTVSTGLKWEWSHEQRIQIMIRVQRLNKIWIERGKLKRIGTEREYCSQRELLG